MPFSIWEYLRQRTRDSVLAGFNDALDIAEQADTDGSQNEAASRLRSRLAAGSLSPTEPKQLPHPSTNGVVPQVTTSPEAPTGLADASSFDDELEGYLNDGASQQAEEAAQTGNRPQWKDTDPPVIRKRGRGRPRKDDAS